MKERTWTEAEILALLAKVMFYNSGCCMDDNDDCKTLLDAMADALAEE